MTCSCNDTGRVLANRDKRTVEAACGRCTPRRLAAIEAENARMGKVLLNLSATLLALGLTPEQVDAAKGFLP